ncbi:MAG TPA: AI-2E family transporter [Gaiella sp.]|nr:AI-2E family transporter [Gaiella sp.]
MADDPSAAVEASPGALSRSRRTLETGLTLRTLLVAALVVGVAAALVSILDALLLVFLGIFLALVFEIPVRAFMRWTGRGRGLSATIVVLGTAAGATVLALILLVPLVGSIRDFLKDLPTLVEDLRQSDELSWLGDSGSAENVQDGANDLSATIPDAIGALLGVAGQAFTVGLSLFTVLFLALFLLVDLPRLQEVVRSMLVPADAERWLEVWERVTETVSRWAIGAITIAAIAGTTQGLTAALLGSSYALALGLIAGFLDLIPNIGATIAAFVLVPTIWAEEGLTDALIMLAVVLVYQQVENNLLSPTIYGKAVNISPFFVILGVTLFGALLGVMGALVAVPITASIQIVVQEVTKARRARIAAARAVADTAAPP